MPDGREGRAHSVLDGLPHTPLQHFALYFYGAVLRVVERAARHYDSLAAARTALPFLDAYLLELQALGLTEAGADDVSEHWRTAVLAWESEAPHPLPLSRLRRRARLTADEVTLLLQIGLPDEDPRFGRAYDVLQGGVGDRRPTLALLASSWPPDEGFDARAAVHRLGALGLIEGPAADGGAVRPVAAAWDALRGSDAMSSPWMRLRAHASLPTLASLVLPEGVRAEAARVPGVLASGAAEVVLLRGARHNGRSTIAAAIAQAMGRSALEVRGLAPGSDPRWRAAAIVACLLDAVILTAGEPGPSETFALPDLPEGLAPVMVSLGPGGGIAGDLADRAVTLRIPIPEPRAREQLWRSALGGEPGGVVQRRLTTGNIVRAARLARAGGALPAEPAARERALRDAIRTLERPGLELLARRVDPAGNWSHLAVSAETVTELASLAARCRQRERLGAVVGPALGGMGAGVRALFKGPSGTGKTLAARLLAGLLGMDLYRVDLASVVNKYIGETEKNLERVFACAEELDVVLLFDEGDALLTQRTGVHSANDRYANLETNYLLQRFETYDGVLLVTTNAGDRIDGAFQRRMDVIIDFPLPEASERWSIWQLHLPEAHEVEPALLDAAAQRCTLSGGQIRNVALHASLLALEEDSPLATWHLEAAIEREYRRQGAQSPLRSSGVR